jgi:spermidine/putrescine transport system permease protein
MNSKFYSKFSIPYVIWLAFLVVIPMLVMFALAFMQTDGISLDGAYFTLDNFRQLLEPSIITAFVNSFKFATLTTLICAVLGYIVAYRLFQSRIKNKLMVLTILILPMWSNLLLRSYALGNIMTQNNMLSDLLANIGISYHLDIRGTDLAVLIGLVISYLPFMILPIYTALEKIDKSLYEASLDLGATGIKTFWRVTFPIALKGLVTGAILVFLPTASGFAIPNILGEGNIILLGTIIEYNFMNYVYNLGSLLAIIVLVVILGSLFVVTKVDSEGETLL